MEWMNRAGRPSQPGQTVTPNANPASGAAHAATSRRKKEKSFSFHNVSSVVLLFSITLLAISLISLLMVYKSNDESRFVAEDKMQAVFLNGGQVYFGKIRALNDKYVGMTDIYYLRVNQQVQPKQGQQAQQDISLVKLGCELHGPQDQMLINRQQVVFWENLKADGQVADAVEKYKENNPNGQKCETGTKPSSNSGNSNTNNTTTPANNNADTTTPTTNNP